MIKFKGFIFDIDGTLASTNELIFATFNHVTNIYLGKTYTPEDIIKLFGPTEDVILKKWMGDNYESARREYYKFYESNHDSMVEVFEGIEPILQSIKSYGIASGIFTGKGRESSFITLKKTGLLKYFDLIVTGDDVADHKPSPEGILKFINHFHLKPENVLMIGDAPSDVIAAKDAGVRIASVMWDSYSKNKLLNMKSDFYFESPDILKNFILKNINPA